MTLADREELNGHMAFLVREALFVGRYQYEVLAWFEHVMDLVMQAERAADDDVLLDAEGWAANRPE
jgi:hypothetical protein